MSILLPDPVRRAALRSAAIAAIACAPGLARAVAAGDAAPELSAQADGAPVRLADHRGRIVYLDFWASWCAPCRLSFPWMNAMQARHGAQGLQVIAVNLDAKPEAARRFLAETQAAFAVAFDPAGDTARRYAIRAMPTSLLIDADGRVLATHAGFRDTDRMPLEAMLKKALDDRAAAERRASR
jgi:cytochrome c biogenesis protein CcmG/thiol:disulfide interchange protein DsbE